MDDRGFKTRIYRVAVLLRSTRRYWRQMLDRATVNEYASSNERTKKATLRFETKNKDVKIRTRSKKIRERGVLRHETGRKRDANIPTDDINEITETIQK